MVTVIRQSHAKRFLGTFAICAVTLGAAWFGSSWPAYADTKAESKSPAKASDAKKTEAKKTEPNKAEPNKTDKPDKKSVDTDKAAAEKNAPEKGAEEKAGAEKAPKSITLKEAFATGSSDVLIQFINEKVRQGWIENNIEPSPVADDGEWMRRVYLDIIGHVPPVEDVEAFIADKDKAKRTKVIDKLLDDPAYVRNWTTIWANLLVGRGAGNANMGGPQRRAALQKFLRESFAKNRPWDAVVRDLVSAEGRYDQNGAVNFLMAHLNDGAVPATAMTAKLFLGLQVQCTQCHNHPFNEWKQNQFWEYNSIFKQAREVTHQKYDEKTGRMVFDYAELVKQEAEGPVFFERRNGLMQVAYPRYEQYEIKPDADTNRRQEFAKLITQGERTQVADAMVNRMWGHFFGYGFTKPVDDMGPHNPASHPELLEKLSVEFVKAKYDQKQLIRWICNSEAYNLTSKMSPKNEVDNPANGERPKFTHMYVKSLSAEQLYDSLIIATNAHKSGRSNWEQAEQQRRMWMQQFVVAFGTDENDESTTFNGTIPQALMMMNGELVQNAISLEKGGYLRSVLEDKGGDDEKVKEMYMSTLSRVPTKKELMAAKMVIAGGNVQGLVPKEAKSAKASGGAKAGKGPKASKEANNAKEMADAMEMANAAKTANAAPKAAPVKTPYDGYQDLFWALLNSNEFIFNH
ncbi:MAG: hypothetical protein JWM11_4942 [Planctomycetaceae bacterium]|nr:hypothetical protein [Planctomycetaceae bacterium]